MSRRGDIDHKISEARREKRRLADMEKRALIKSAVRILDSDDDEEADREFFEKERELRDRMARKAFGGDLLNSETVEIVSKKRRLAAEGCNILDLGIDDGGSVSGSIPERINVSLSLDDEATDDQSENGLVDDARLAKRRKLLRPISLTSDED